VCSAGDRGEGPLRRATGRRRCVQERNPRTRQQRVDRRGVSLNHVPQVGTIKHEEDQPWGCRVRRRGRSARPCAEDQHKRDKKSRALHAVERSEGRAESSTGPDDSVLREQGRREVAGHSGCAGGIRSRRSTGSILLSRSWSCGRASGSALLGWLVRGKSPRCLFCQIGSGLLFIDAFEERTVIHASFAFHEKMATVVGSELRLRHRHTSTCIIGTRSEGGQHRRQRQVARPHTR